MKSKKQLSGYARSLLRALLCVIPVVAALVAAVIAYPIYLSSKCLCKMVRRRYTSL